MLLRTSVRSSRRSLRSLPGLVSRLHSKPPPFPFPTVPTCPSPTCSCAGTPEMSAGLEIDHSKPLHGTMAAYAEQILICTGQSDWKSRIEEENDGDNIAADLKELLGRGGIYSDPFHNVSVINSSFPPSVPRRSEVQTTSAYLFPSFKYVPFLPRVSFDSVQALVKGYLLPTKLNAAHSTLSPIHKDRLTRSLEYQSLLYGVQDVNDILVLICGHGGRDKRCGILGPVLQAEFETQLPRSGFELLRGSVYINEDVDNDQTPLLNGQQPLESPKQNVRVGLISHIGGHKFAGNVILYIPPTATVADGTTHRLAGCGIWYGRVEPQHVQGIISQTLTEGKVIVDHFRGGIKKDGSILRM